MAPIACRAGDGQDYLEHVDKMHFRHVLGDRLFGDDVVGVKAMVCPPIPIRHHVGIPPDRDGRGGIPDHRHPVLDDGFHFFPEIGLNLLLVFSNVQ